MAGNLNIPQLYDAKTGEAASVSPEQIPQAVLSGKFGFQKGAQIPVIAPDGTPGTIPAEDAHQAFSSGYQFDTPDLQQARLDQDQYGSGLGNEALAGAAGFARGATLGLSDEALTATGAVEPDTLAKLQKYNPTVSKVGEIAGVTAPVLLSDGAAAPAAAELAPASLVADAGKSIAGAVADHLGAQTAESAAGRIAANVAGKAVGGAAEGALFGLGSAVTEHALGDPDLTAEKVISHVGMGAVLGGALGGAFGTAEDLIPAAVSKAKSITDKVGETLGDLFPNSALSRLSGFVSGKDTETIETLTRGPFTDEGMAIRKAALESPSARDATARELAQNLEDHQDAMKDAIKTTFDENRPEEIDRSLELFENKTIDPKTLNDAEPEEIADMLRPLPDGDKIAALQKLDSPTLTRLFDEVDPGEVSPLLRGMEPEDAIDFIHSNSPAGRILNQALGLSAKLRRTAAEMRAEPEIYSATGRIKKLEQLADRLDNQLKGEIRGDAGEKLYRADGTPKIRSREMLKSPSEIFKAMDEAKQEIGKISKFGKLTLDTEQDTISKIRGLGADFKEHLQDEKLYGQAGARQSAFNDAYNEYSTAQKQFRKFFTSKTPTRSGGFKFKISPAKIETFLNKVGRTRGIEAEQALSDYMLASKKLVEQMGETAKASTKGLDTGTLERLSERAQATSGKAVHEIGLSNKLKSITQHVGEGIGPAAMIAGGAELAGVSALPYEAAYGAYSMLKNPATYVKTLYQLERMSRKVGEAVDAAVKGFTGIVKSTQKAAVPSSIDAFKSFKVMGEGASRAPAGTPRDKREAFKKRFDEISDLVSNPSAMNETLSESLSHMGKVAPNVSQSLQATAMRGAQFLYDKAPKDPLAGASLQPLFKKWHPSDAEISKWERYVSAVNDPVSVLEDMRSGMISSEGVEALKTVYPKLYESVVSKLTAQVSKMKDELPYAKRLQLSTLFGLPLDPSVQPDFIALLQSFHSQADAQEAAGQGGAEPGIVQPTPGALAKLGNANAVKTDTERVLTRS